MGAKKTVNLENLEGLGARRLAELLLELGGENTEIRRRLRLELAGEAGAEAIAADITKRLAALRRARSFIDWQQRRSFVKDIDLQREMITTKVAEARPDLALDLMWRFMDLAEPTLNRVDDSYGDVGDVFRQACRDLGAIAGKAMPDPIQTGRAGLPSRHDQRLRRIRPADRRRLFSAERTRHRMPQEAA